MGIFDKNRIQNQSITLDANTYVAGSIVRGTFKFSLDGEMSFRSLSLKFVGREYAYWREGKNGHRRDINTIFKSYVVLAGMAKRTRADKANGLDSGAAKDWRGTLPAGAYCYPFAFKIPTGSPPTMLTPLNQVGTFASVEYKVQAHFDIPWGSDASIYKSFTVQTPMPISQYNALRHRPIASGPQKVDLKACGCCSKGSSTATLTVDRSCIVFNGDDENRFVKGTVSINNADAEVAVNGLTVSLVERDLWYARYGAYPLRRARVVTTTTIFTNCAAKDAAGDKTFDYSLDVVFIAGDDDGGGSTATSSSAASSAPASSTSLLFILRKLHATAQHRGSAEAILACIMTASRQGARWARRNAAVLETSIVGSAWLERGDDERGDVDGHVDGAGGRRRRPSKHVHASLRRAH